MPNWIYLRVSTPEHIDHDLHYCLMHAQSSHQIGMLVEHLVTHYITGDRKTKCKQSMEKKGK